MIKHKESLETWKPLRLKKMKKKELVNLEEVCWKLVAHYPNIDLSPSILRLKLAQVPFKKYRDHFAVRKVIEYIMSEEGSPLDKEWWKDTNTIRRVKRRLNDCF